MNTSLLCVTLLKASMFKHVKTTCLTDEHQHEMIVGHNPPGHNPPGSPEDIMSPDIFPPRLGHYPPGSDWFSLWKQGFDY